jgi:molecular chaperone HscB
MQVDLTGNYYELFGLSPQFQVDETALAMRFQELQKLLHPDRFASAPAAQRRWSMQASSFVNEGYQTLQHELKRAIYLLKLNRISVDEETDTHMAPQFLLEQMEFREALEAAECAADPHAKLDGLRHHLKSSVREKATAFNHASGQQDWVDARTIVRQWQFLDKLTSEVRDMEERLDT